MITLQQLTYFRELAKTCHLTQTAEKLYITQATLSNTMANLEKQLGVKLFERAGRGLRLSRAGELYCGYVLQALDLLEAGQSEIEGLLREQESWVSVAVNNSVAWAESIRDFMEMHKTCSVRQINCIDAERTRTMLVNMEVDYAIAGTTDFSLTSLEYELLREEPLGICLPAEHPLAERAQVALCELCGEKFINLPGEHPFQRYCDRLLDEAGVQRKVVLESDYRMNTRLIEGGAGIALTTFSAYRNSASALGGRTVCVPVAAPSRTIALVWNPRRRLSREARTFREYLLQWEAERA